MEKFSRINTDFDYRTAVIFGEQQYRADCVVFRGAGVVGVTDMCVPDSFDSDISP